MTTPSSLSFIHVSIETNYKIWIIPQKNKTTITTNSEVFSSEQHPISNIMWFRFLLIIVIFVTAAGNILVCLAIARERKLQNTTNYFLMSLAIADCMVALLVMPMGMIAEAFGHFPLPHYCCVIFATADVLCCTSSIWHMSTMSMDRYFTIRFPFRYGRNKTKRIMLLKIIAVWAISLAISSPIFVLGIVDRRNVLINGICAPNNATFKVIGGVFAFYIPFIIMIVTYALTMRSLRNVLVHKRRYNRERRRDQTFRPLATIINQYAEIAHELRKTGRTTTTTTKTVVKKIPYAIITTTTASPIDKNHQFFFSSNGTLLMDQKNDTNRYGSFTTSNGQVVNISPTYMKPSDHETNHLTIAYIKHHSKKKQYDVMQRKDCDMSTVYEMTEYSKSSSSSDYRLATSSCVHQRRSVVIVDQTSTHPCEQQSYSESQNKEEQKIEFLNTNQLKEVAIIENQISEVVKEESDDDLPIVVQSDTNINTTLQSLENTTNNSVCLPKTSHSIEECFNFVIRLAELIYRYYYVNNHFQSAQKQLEYRNFLPIEYSSHHTGIVKTSPILPWSDTVLQPNNPSSNIYQGVVEIDATCVNNTQTICPTLLISTVPSKTQPNRILSTNNYTCNNDKLDVAKHYQSTSVTTSMTCLIENKQTTSVSTQTDNYPSIPKSISSFSEKNHDQHNVMSNRTKRAFSFSKRFLCTSLSTATPTRSQSEDEHAAAHVHSNSLFTNFFRHHKPKRSISNTGTGSGAGNSSTKSSLSWGQHSLSSYNQQKSAAVPHHHSSLLRQIECEMDSVLAQQRSRGSSASSIFFNNKLHHKKRRDKKRSVILSNIHNSTSGNSLRQQQIHSSSTSSSTFNSDTSNSRISRFLTSQRQQQHHFQQQQQEKIVAQNERKALRVLLIIFCVFVTLWTPFFICTFISAVCEKCREKIPSILWFWITWLGYTSSMANPVVYTIFSDTFRRAFCNLLRCRSSDSLFANQLSTKLSFQKGAIIRRPNGTGGCSGTSTPIGRERERNNNQDATIYVNKYNHDAIR